VLATRPKISDGKFTREDVTNRSVNLLYFGSFYKMSFREFDEGFKEMMDDGDFLYGTLSKNTYWQGKVLGRKFRLLSISYTIFLYGIVAAVFAFLAAVIFFKYCCPINIFKIEILSLPTANTTKTCHSEGSPNFIGNNEEMTESCISAVISIRQLAEGEISSNKQISLSPEARRDDKKISICHWQRSKESC